MEVVIERSACKGNSNVDAIHIYACEGNRAHVQSYSCVAIAIIAVADVAVVVVFN